jgi:predicted S18 family serine protease
LVLPIGGLKEKTLAAKRAGIREVIIPKRNEKDLPDIPEEVRNTLKFHLVNTVDEALEVAVGGKKGAPRGTTVTAPPAGTRAKDAPVANGKSHRADAQKPDKTGRDRPKSRRPVPASHS